MSRIPFFAVRHQPPNHRRWLLISLSFLLPLGLWCAISYVPWLWHPLVELRLGGGPVYAVGDRVPVASWQELLVTDAAWAAELKAERLRIDGDPVLFCAVPGEAPTPAGRSLRRSNQKAVFSFAPALLAAGRISAEDERDADRLRVALDAWRNDGYATKAWRLQPENRRRIDLLLAAAPPGEELPEDQVLPPAAPQGVPANPVFLPPPHAVAQALVTGFTTPPLRDGDPWLHERLLHSLWIVVKGFGLALAIGLPLGVLAGSFPALSRLIEPVTGFVGYIPPPAFAALLVAVLGLQDGPKVGIVFIASVFPMIIMVANTVRGLDRAILEAAQTLGAGRRSLVMRVIIPGSLPRMIDDLRVLLALGWTILIIAEITGEKSGLSAYMEQQGRYRQYDRVFAAMLIIGCLGLVVDRCIALLRPLFFPWAGDTAPRWLRWLWSWAMWLPGAAVAAASARDRSLADRLATRRSEDVEKKAPHGH